MAFNDLFMGATLALAAGVVGAALLAWLAAV